MPLRREAGHGRVRMLRILKGSSPQQETKNQPGESSYPSRWSPSAQKVSGSGFLRDSHRGLSTAPIPAQGLCCPPRNSPLSAIWKEGCALFKIVKQHRENQANQLVANMNLEVGIGSNGLVGARRFLCGETQMYLN